MIVTPIQFLAETEQYNFLFEIAKDKIISALAVSDSDESYRIGEGIFYDALAKFIEHGRIKFIPDDQLKVVLKYYT